MIKRIVRMTFREEEVADFIQIFQDKKAAIRAFPGCRHLELFRDIHRRNVFFTYSFWEDEQALEAYRESELFRNTWAKTKKLFADRPAAWSVEVIAEESG